MSRMIESTLLEMPGKDIPSSPGSKPGYMAD
jgi:hypothetical protein